MTDYFAPSALLPEHWTTSVRIAVGGATPELVERGMTPAVIFPRGSREARWIAAFANNVGSGLPTMLANARVQPVSLSSPRKPLRRFLDNLQ